MERREEVFEKFTNTKRGYIFTECVKERSRWRKRGPSEEAAVRKEKKRGKGKETEGEREMMVVCGTL